MQQKIDYCMPDDGFVRSIDILTLLPHRKPFVMVGRLEHFEMLRCVSSMVVECDNMMVEEGVLSEAGMLENVAQTCALRIGYLNTYVLNQKVRPGYIGAIDRTCVYLQPHVGERIETEINIVAELAGYLMVHASQRLADGSLLLECDVKLSV